MADFPRTMVGGLSLPRLICGSNFGTHFSSARNRFARQLGASPSRMADCIEVFARHGCNAFMSCPFKPVADALREVEQRTGQPMYWIATPWYAGSDLGRIRWDSPDLDDDWKRAVDETKALGAHFCFPHMAITDFLLDRINRRLMPQLIRHLQYVREAGMLPGLSTHTPQSIICADNTDDGVIDSYIQPYNAAGFLCEVAVERAHQVIHSAHKPVMVIKPLASGRLTPFAGLTFVWNTIRDCDLVTLGVMSPDEAEESIEISLSILEKRQSETPLPWSRSEATIAVKPPASDC